MRLCTYEIDGPLGRLRRVGAAVGGRVVDVNLAYALMVFERDRHPRHRALADVLVPADMLALLETEGHGLTAAREALAHLGERAADPDVRGPAGELLSHAEADLRLLAPLPRPPSLRDGMAFEEHVVQAFRNMRQEPPKVFYDLPLYYKSNPRSFVGTGADVRWPPWTERLDYELEFACVIGRTGRDIPAERADEHVAGYTVFNDVSARDQQGREMAGQLGPTKGKDLDGGNIIGPYLVTADEFDPRDGHAMVARVNGEEWSRGSTAAMYYSMADLIAYISRDETLYPGDMIGSGTVGTGCGLELGRWPRPGDVVECEVEGIGVLRNRFVRVDG